MIKKILNDLEIEIKNTINLFKKESEKYSLNKINTNILENLKINYYNTSYKLSQISVLNIDNQTVIIKPFDSNIIPTICNEIHKLNIDLNVITTNDFIKIIYPQNTIERRNLFIKKLKEVSENYKINIRNIRRDFNAKIKLLTKNNLISKDEEQKTLQLIQKTTDENITILNNLILKKTAEMNKI